MSAVTLATNSIPPLDGEGARFFKRAGWGEASPMHYRFLLEREGPHPSVARATPDLPARGRYGANGDDEAG